LIWLIWSVWFFWLNETKQTNQINQTDQPASFLVSREGAMKRRGSFTITMCALALSWLLTVGCVSGGDPAALAQSAGAIDLSGVPPNWDKALPSAQRFVLLASVNNDAVRDNNTGLVWEKSPQIPTACP
jgi:hypothetical protein